MSKFNDSRYLTVRNDEQWDAYLRCRLRSDGDWNVANSLEKATGSSTRWTGAAGELTTLRLRRGGTHKLIANGAIAAGAEVFAASNGKVASSGTVFEGFALEAATADGDVIECTLE